MSTIEASLKSLPSDINHCSADAVVASLQQCIDGAGDELVIDVSGVEHCDSAGIAALLEGKKHAHARSVVLLYTGAQAQLKALAKFLKVDAVLFSAH